jgi:5-methylcytosine-specific restriction endonuclease McrA
MKLTSQQKKSRMQKKADRALQELVRRIYTGCMVCGKDTDLGHHYYPKSTCSALRYDLQNIIPLCQGCHFSHHNGNPEIHNAVNQIKGKEWLDKLEVKKRIASVKPSIAYYENIIKILNSITK